MDADIKLAGSSVSIEGDSATVTGDLSVGGTLQAKKLAMPTTTGFFGTYSFSIEQIHEGTINEEALCIRFVSKVKSTTSTEKCNLIITKAGRLLLEIVPHFPQVGPVKLTTTYIDLANAIRDLQNKTKNL
jgi:hypothetical protein